MLNVGRWFNADVNARRRTNQRRRLSPGRMRLTSLRPNSCFVIDNDAAARRTVVNALEGRGAACTELASADELFTELNKFAPSMIFLDISLRDSDAVEALRGLASRKYGGAIQLISGRRTDLISRIYAIGIRRGLKMLPPLAKPCSVRELRQIAADQLNKLDEQDQGDFEDLVVDLDLALQMSWVEVWYQPKIDLRKKCLAGLEALARIRHPDFGIVLPAEFLKHASRPSLRRLTEHVIVSSIGQWREIKRVGFAPKIAINVSADCLVNVDIAKLVREHQPKDGSWCGMIFELKEDQAIRELEIIQEAAAQLMIYDISFSIDDFGSGHFPFERLKQFVFSEVSLDASFVRGCSENEQNAAICRSIIELAHGFRAIAVGKGVEDPEDLIALYRMDCDLAQGHLLSRPMPMDELLPFLRMKARSTLALDGHALPNLKQVDFRDAL